MVKTPANPGGLPIEVFDDFRKQLAANRAQFYLDVASGQLGEIHDASDDEAAALFGFFAIGAQRRRAMDEADLKALCRAQLTRLFGDPCRSGSAPLAQRP